VVLDVEGRLWHGRFFGRADHGALRLLGFEQEDELRLLTFFFETEDL